MNNTILNGCDFSGSNMKDVEFGMYPSINAGTSVNSVCTSKDGKYICCGGEDGKIKIWDFKQ